jgi:hypothetical protein
MSFKTRIRMLARDRQSRYVHLHRAVHDLSGEHKESTRACSPRKVDVLPALCLRLPRRAREDGEDVKDSALHLLHNVYVALTSLHR